MPHEVEKFIRIQRLHRAPDGADPEWRTIPNGFRVRIWEMSTVDAVEGEDGDGHASRKRYIFHIAHMPMIERGCRVTYLGGDLTVLSVSDSTRLLGLEIRCAPEGAAG